MTSSPAGMSCGSDCTEHYGTGTDVTLTAAAGSSAVFDGWGGACSGQAVTCTLTMDQSRSVTAAFADVTQLTIRVSNTRDIGGVFGSPYGSNVVRRNGVAV